MVRSGWMKTGSFTRIMGNFYMGINKTNMPVRMFSGTRDAKNWLKDYLP
jgi:hypothetical protein